MTFVKLLARRGTASEWTTANPTLDRGEFGFEHDTNKLKIGNGTNNWNTLPYLTGVGGGGSITSVNGDTGPAVTLVAADIPDFNSTVASLITGKADAGLPGLPAGVMLYARKTAGVWPARPTSRADLAVAWIGPEPSPSIVSSGTGGMREDLDIRIITP